MGKESPKVKQNKARTHVPTIQFLQLVNLMGGPGPAHPELVNNANSQALPGPI